MIHKTAIIDTNAKISSNVEIGAYTVIGPNVEIDENTIIHSHVNIFGHTKNALMFMAPWNIVYIPKLFDPFSGHESKGELTQTFTSKLKEITYEKFKVQIDDYNSIVNNSKFIDSLNSSIENLKSNNSEMPQKLLNSIKDEFLEVKI